ncbi:MAG TPA: response regulator transcription factor [Longimicrobiales bacterium]|nr:response regulator transcription factor [Longimicrobiales bacterium]
MKILVIDDDPLIIEFVRRGLVEDGYTVDSAVSGSEGLLCARMGSYDAVILDVGLPDTSGFNIAQEMRREGDATPILMLTARSGTDNLVQGLDAGADDYLTKPFDLRELRARLRALTRRGGSTRTEEVVLGGLTLDRLSHEVRAGERALRLTPKEYRLLEYFMLRPGETISRTELLEKVWEMNFDPQSNIVDVHVARLRQKLKRYTPSPLLETVRGFGFRLTDEPAEDSGRDADQQNSEEE